ncbi:MULTISPECIES: transporter suffix domain-containing protein [Paenibacillus]|uniref:Transporter suffix domain-containing protein n=1 Tax=Paenibacillus whitsoniae TaxID=2496558 RepID=A0A430JDJ2_9BACL|nr:transporter suffix domain-containing protein [Paenibacillus whitsoniae]RTE09065.1 transporter suffix domain-containing protein [Paenibacillus whitsoniae]
MNPKQKFLYRAGLTFIIVSLTLWLTPFTVPFLPLDTKTKTGVISVALVISEICFWIGVLFVGKEVAKRIRSYLNPKNWRKGQRAAQHTDKESP